MNERLRAQIANERSKSCAFESGAHANSFSVKEKSVDEVSVEWTDEATVKLQFRQEGRRKIWIGISVLQSQGKSGLFLFLEQPAQRINCVSGILCTRLGDVSERPARATELRFQHVGRDSTHIGNKLWIGSGALNHKRNGGAAFATTAL